MGVKMAVITPCPTTLDYFNETGVFGPDVQHDSAVVFTASMRHPHGLLGNTFFCLRRSIYIQWHKFWVNQEVVNCETVKGSREEKRGKEGGWRTRFIKFSHESEEEVGGRREGGGNYFHVKTTPSLLAIGGPTLNKALM